MVLENFKQTLVLLLGLKNNDENAHRFALSTIREKEIVFGYYTRVTYYPK